MDRIFMQRCFKLARAGLGTVSPNPLVGCVIVENNQIIGEGFHAAAGEAHAEVNAINSVVDKDRLKRSTLYVNLEPCAHFGKTPPCAPLIVQHNIPKVVIANRDPFAEVDGKGIEMLRKAGISVSIGCEKKQGAYLNRRFFTFHQKQRPYIILKFAQTANGFFDRDRTHNEKGINWITTDDAQYLTHSWRSQEDAILIGTQTGLIDNPSLTVRRISGNQPHRLVIDRELKISTSSNVFSTDGPTTIFNGRESKTSQHISWVKLDFTIDVIPQILDWMHQRNMQSLIVEGGAHTISQFVNRNEWDEARILTGASSFASGVRAPVISGKVVDQFNIGIDQVSVIERVQ